LPVADRRLGDAGSFAPGSPIEARQVLTQATLAWQRQQPADALAALQRLAGTASSLPDTQRARLSHLEARVLAGTGHSEAAVAPLHAAWRVHRLRGDLLGEGLVVRDLGELYWTRGRLLDAVRLLRRAEVLLRQAEAAPAQAEVLLVLGQLLTQIGDLDDADAQFARVLRLVDKSQQRLIYAAAVTGQGWILVNRGRFEDAMGLLAQCLKDLGRRAVREPVYVEALLGLATNFTVFSRGEKLVVGGLRYASDAADRAMEIGYLPGLVQALVIQVRGLVGLNRLGEAESRLAELDAALDGGERKQPELARLRTQVEFSRSLVLTALGDPGGAQIALERARAELMLQVNGLEGSGFERGFMTNLYPHREILEAVG
jgi:tetratricopeptide (TPR) repeat protein